MSPHASLHTAVATARSSLGQVSWASRSLQQWTGVRRQYDVIRHITLPDLPRSRRVPGSVWAVSVVRDEADVIGDVLDHTFDQGVDHILVADNNSVDGTRELLAERAAADPRVHVALDSHPAHLQSAKVSWLAHQAWRSGADWILPIDADEFWYARGATVADWLRSRGDAAIVHASFHHMVPTRPHPHPLRSATFVLDATPSHPGKVAVRAGALTMVGPGHPLAARTGRVEPERLFIAHAQYRGPAQLARKVRQGTQAAQRTGADLSWFSPHWVAGSRLVDDEIAAVWDNLSHGRPDERIQYAAAGPMVTVDALSWHTWDPDRQVPDPASLPVRTESDVVPGRNRQGMVSTYATALRDRDHRAAMRRSRAGLDLPRRAAGADPADAVWAVTMVKNEADVIATTVTHLLAQGVARVLVMDNGSTDETPEILAELAREHEQVLTGRDHEVGYYQAAKMTLLSRYAAAHGAGWVVPFDADELWFAAEGTLASYLRATSADVAAAAVFNVWPTADAAVWRMETAAHEYPKVAFRPHPLALLRTGNHWVSRSGPRAVGLRIAHYPWRSFEQFARKVRQGSAAYAATNLPSDQGAHWRALGALSDESLHERWSALLDGQPDESLSWSPVGPFVRADPRSWTGWQASV